MMVAKKLRYSTQSIKFVSTSQSPRAASITMSAASAREAPVTMFLRNSMWPGASMMMYRRLSDLKKQRAVSIVMP